MENAKEYVPNLEYLEMQIGSFGGTLDLTQLPVRLGTGVAISLQGDSPCLWLQHNSFTEVRLPLHRSGFPPNIKELVLYNNDIMHLNVFDVSGGNLDSEDNTTDSTSDDSGGNVTLYLGHNPVLDTEHLRQKLPSYMVLHSPIET